MQQKHLNFIQLFSQQSSAVAERQPLAYNRRTHTHALAYSHTHRHTGQANGAGSEAPNSPRERARERESATHNRESKLQQRRSLFAAAAADALPGPVYVCCAFVCVFECALRAKLIFLFIKKKSKYICIFVCCAAFFFSSPSSCFLPPPHTEYYFCCCCQKHNLCFIYDFL